ncbi:MAG: hypothetical protein JXM74_02530 [Fusobacteriaceae bacterium]|nr:hypothetical protein [Fusobacteriaceae bacterium]MBN2837612.1 hypothetical protein [Fusobacteriaceae bacterium]
MKKSFFITALIVLSAQVLAAEDTGYVRTGLESGNRIDGDGKSVQFNNWILADGYFKGDNWGNFQLGYLAEKEFNKNNKDDGKTNIELTPGYGKNTDWGYYGGQVTFAVERWGASEGGTDTIKPKFWATYNINGKSRIETKALYAFSKGTPKEDYKEVWSSNANGGAGGYVKVDTSVNADSYLLSTFDDDGKSHWFEAEAQYKYDIFGGTIGAGLYYGQNIKDKYNKTDSNIWSGGGTETVYEQLSAEKNYYKISYLLNYSKYFSTIKTYASLYGEYKDYKYKYGVWDYNDKDKKQEYEVGLYMNKNFDNKFSLDGEIKRTADLTKSKGGDYVTENLFALGLKYNF